MARSRLDLGRVASAALEAALDDGSHRHRGFSRLGAIATGAALVGAARVAVSKAPGLLRLPDLAEVGDRLHDRLADHGWIVDEDEDIDDDEPRDEGDEDVGEDERDIDDDEGPPDEDWDDEAPRDEADLDDEGEDLDEDEDGDESWAADEADADEDEGDGESAPPLARGKGRRTRAVDPVARPPEPPDSDGSAATTRAGSR
jgi:hypothetical protein